MTRLKQVRVLRAVRKIHRLTGISLIIVFFVVASSGLLLGWKKHTGGVILPKTQRGSSTEVATWLSTDSLKSIACTIARDSVSSTMSLKLDRIDYRPQKGVAKFVFEENYLGVQLDCATGEPLYVGRRWSDLIENIHDGSILDHLFKTDHGQLKLIYATTVGMALITFVGTGFWMWYGTRVLRRGD